MFYLQPHECSRIYKPKKIWIKIPKTGHKNLSIASDISFFSVQRQLLFVRLVSDHVITGNVSSWACLQLLRPQSKYSRHSLAAARHATEMGGALPVLSVVLRESNRRHHFLPESKFSSTTAVCLLEIQHRKRILEKMWWKWWKERRWKAGSGWRCDAWR